MTEKGHSDRPIAVGDIVQVVRGPFCCNSERLLGLVFQIQQILPDSGGSCFSCRQFYVSTDAINPSSGRGIDVRRLKRIPPLDEPAETYTTEQHKEKV